MKTFKVVITKLINVPDGATREDIEFLALSEGKDARTTITITRVGGTVQNDRSN